MIISYLVNPRIPHPATLTSKEGLSLEVGLTEARHVASVS
jgi:hypothetical protein